MNISTKFSFTKNESSVALVTYGYDSEPNNKGIEEFITFLAYRFAMRDKNLITQVTAKMPD